MAKRRKKICIPAQKVKEDILKIDEPKSIIFSFDFLDRYHELFNMGDNKNNPLNTEVGWFLDLLDCLNSVSKLTRNEFNNNKTYDLHPINWNNTNVKCSDDMEQYEFYQFRINKSKGRIIGFFIDNCFHIVWLDRHHNLTNSEGYGKEKYYNVPLSLYENKKWELNNAYKKIEELEAENNIYKGLLEYGKGNF